MAHKMLIVDDQKGVRRLLEELFKKEGWEVSSASDGCEAINEVEQVKPEVILMDMKMPNMNGLEAAQKILSKHNDITIIMMTAYGEVDEVRQAMECGVKKCISKPFDIIDLRNIVNELVLGRVS